MEIEKWKLENGNWKMEFGNWKLKYLWNQYEIGSEKDWNEIHHHCAICIVLY